MRINRVGSFPVIDFPDGQLTFGSAHEEVVSGIDISAIPGTSPRFLQLNLTNQTRGTLTFFAAQTSEALTIAKRYMFGVCFQPPRTEAEQRCYLDLHMAIQAHANKPIFPSPIVVVPSTGGLARDTKHSFQSHAHLPPTTQASVPVGSSSDGAMVSSSFSGTTVIAAGDFSSVDQSGSTIYFPANLGVGFELLPGASGNVRFVRGTIAWHAYTEDLSTFDPNR